MKTSALSTVRLLPARSRNGGVPRRSALVVAAPATPTGLECSRETVITLTALLYSLFGYTLQSDVIYLAMLQAEQEALKMGVSKKDFERIKKAVMKTWWEKRNGNPLSCMF